MRKKINKCFVGVFLLGVVLVNTACTKEQSSADLKNVTKAVTKTEMQSEKKNTISEINPATEMQGIYSRAELVKPLSVGQQVPKFNVKTADGQDYTVNPEDLEKPVVLTFFRGGWCPYCNRHLADMRTLETKLKAKGFDVWFMSIDKPELLYESLKEPDIGYTLFSDAGLEATKSFGIGFVVDAETIVKYTGYGIDLEKASGQKHHVLPAPSTFIIGKGGRVHFQYTNPDYTVRIAPEDLLKAAEQYVSEH